MKTKMKTVYVVMGTGSRRGNLVSYNRARTLVSRFNRLYKSTAAYYTSFGKIPA